jgi:hypothetical protein
MNKYRIHIDPPLPDRDRIARYQDFDSLYGQYQTHARFEFWRNLYRKPHHFALLVMVAIVGILVFRSKEEAAAERPYRLLPAAEQLDLPRGLRTVSSAEPTDLVLTPQVQVHIPASAWQDSSGQLIEGPVSLHHRVLIGPEKAFVAGVPRPREQATLQALHLVEIYATQDGRRLQLRAGYPLRVSWPLTQELPQLAVQHLDDEAQRWIPVGKSKVSPLPAEASPKPQRPAILDQKADTLIAKGAKTPTPPRRPFGVSLSNPEAYPEFRQYQKVYWEAVPRPGTVDPWEAGLTQPQNDWEDVSVRKLPVTGLYELRFIRVTAQGGIEIKRVAARPVFEAETEAEAQRIWEQRKATYQRTIAELRREDSLLKVQQNRIAAARRAYEAELAAWEAAHHRATDAPAGWSLTYELEQPGVSGYWQRGEQATLSQELAFPTEEMKHALPPSLLPWCYAVVENRWLPLAINEDGVQLPATEQAATLWWVYEDKAYRWRPDDSPENISLVNLSTPQALSAWLQGLRSAAL